MTLRWGHIIFGFAFLLLSVHPLVVESLAWLIPINEQGERPYFASAGLVLVGMASSRTGASGTPGPAPAPLTRSPTTPDGTPPTR